jgi:hypothetical protein
VTLEHKVTQGYKVILEHKEILGHKAQQELE